MCCLSYTMTVQLAEEIKLCVFIAIVVKLYMKTEQFKLTLYLYATLNSTIGDIVQCFMITTSVIVSTVMHSAV